MTQQSRHIIEIQLAGEATFRIQLSPLSFRLLRDIAHAGEHGLNLAIWPHGNGWKLIQGMIAKGVPLGFRNLERGRTVCVLRAPVQEVRP